MHPGGGRVSRRPTICRPPIRRARRPRYARLRKLAEDAKLDPDFAEKFLNFIVKEVIRHHEAIAKTRLNSRAPLVICLIDPRLVAAQVGSADTRRDIFLAGSRP